MRGTGICIGCLAPLLGRGVGVRINLAVAPLLDKEGLGVVEIKMSDKNIRKQKIKQ